MANIIVPHQYLQTPFTTATDCLPDDSGNIWVIDQSVNSINKVRNDGTFLANYPYTNNNTFADFLVSDNDGNMWVLMFGNTGTNKWTKINPSGTTLLEHDASISNSTAIGSVSDGVNLYMLCQDLTTTHIFVDKIDITTGAAVATYNTGINGNLDSGGNVIDFDGTFIWFILVSGDVYKVTAATMTISHHFPAGTFPNPNASTDLVGINCAGGFVWWADSISKVIVIDGIAGTLVGVFSVGNAPVPMMSDGTRMWVYNRDDKSFTLLNISDGSLFGTFTSTLLSSIFDSLAPLKFDGSSMWAADFNNYLWKFTLYVTPTIGPTVTTFDAGSGILTPAFDNSTPRQRKDSFTIRGRANGIFDVHVITDLSGEITIGTVNTGGLLIDFILDLQQLIDVAAGTNKHPTWYQVRIINYGPFSLSDLEIFFEERPIPLTFKKGYNNNFESSSPKRLRAQPYVIDTRGHNVTYTPVIDGADGTPVIFNTNEKLTVQWSPNTDIFATDFGYKMVWGGSDGFELWNDQTPAILQTLPQGYLFYQVGPQDLFRYGRLQGFEFRVFSSSGLTAIPYTVYFNDFVIESGSIAVITNKENMVYVETSKSAAGSALRIEFGPTTIIFYPYYVRAKCAVSGRDTDVQWLPL